MPTIRVVKKKGRLQEALVSPSVPVFAKAVFATAIVLAESGERDVRDLLDCFGEDEDKVYRAIMKLRTLGYCKRVKVDGVTQFRFYGSRVTSRVKNKNSDSYSKNQTQAQGPPKQIREREGTQREDEFGDWDEFSPTEPENNGFGIVQPSFLKERVKKTEGPVHEVIPNVAHHMLYRICFLAETENDLRLLSSSARGRVANALGRLRPGRADLSQLNRFEDWWNKNWRSKSGSGQYQPPTPEQVVDFWLQAMKHDYKPPTPVVPVRPVAEAIDLSALIRSKHHHD